MENNSTKNTEEIKQKHKVRDLESISAYALLGWSIGTFPLILYFAIDLYKAVYVHDSSSESIKSNLNFSLIVIVVCSIVGLIMGGVVGLSMIWARRQENRILLPILLSPFLGLLWAIVTGGIIGIPMIFFISIFFIFAIISFAMDAAPFGITGFTLFSIIYESCAARRRVPW